MPSVRMPNYKKKVALGYTQMIPSNNSFSGNTIFFRQGHWLPHRCQAHAHTFKKAEDQLWMKLKCTAHDALIVSCSISGTHPKNNWSEIKPIWGYLRSISCRFKAKIRVVIAGPHFFKYCKQDSSVSCASIMGRSSTCASTTKLNCLGAIRGQGNCEIKVEWFVCVCVYKEYFLVCHSLMPMLRSSNVWQEIWLFRVYFYFDTAILLFWILPWFGTPHCFLLQLPQKFAYIFFHTIPPWENECSLQSQKKSRRFPTIPLWPKLSTYGCFFSA